MGTFQATLPETVTGEIQLRVKGAYFAVRAAAVPETPVVNLTVAPEAPVPNGAYEATIVPIGAGEYEVRVVAEDTTSKSTTATISILAEAPTPPSQPGDDPEVADTINILGLPHAYVIGPEGKVWAPHFRHATLGHAYNDGSAIDTDGGLAYGLQFNRTDVDALVALLAEEGWRIPTMAEMDALMEAHGGVPAVYPSGADINLPSSEVYWNGAALPIREAGPDHWDSGYYNGQNTLGFGIRGSGIRASGMDYDRKKVVRLLSAMPDGTHGVFYYISHDQSYVQRINHFFDETEYVSLMLVRDSLPEPEPTPEEETNSMSELDTIIQVDITVEQESITRSTFGIPGIMGKFAADATVVPFTRAREYASLADAAADGWTPGSAMYAAMKSVFSQNPRPAKVVVGRRIPSGGSEVADTNWSSALNAINEENSSWYGFTYLPAESSGFATTELLEVAGWAETNTKVLFAQTDAAAVADPSVTDDVASQLKSLKRRRTALLYRGTANLGTYASIGWFAEGAAYKPGQSTYAYKQIAGSATDKLGSVARNAIFAKNTNIYTTVAGADVTRKGVVSSGEFIDIIVGIDWLTAKIKEDVFAQLVATRKISYDDPGIVSTAAIVQAALEEGARNGILQMSSIKMTVPKYKDIPAADRAARRLTGIKFEALLQGAIHEAVFTGTVTV